MNKYRHPSTPQAPGYEIWARHQADVIRLGDQLRRYLDHPSVRSFHEQMRQFLESPLVRTLQEGHLRMRESLQREHELEAPTPRKRKRAKGGGRRPTLDIETVMKWRQRYRHALQDDWKLRKHDTAVSWLRPKLPKGKRGASKGTLVRHIIRPVLKPESK